MLLTGETLREQRECLGISQAEIAKRAGMSRPTISKYEKNIDQTLTNLLQAYCLEVYPVVGNYHESINELRRITENAIEKSLGVSCKVSIKVELCGEEENERTNFSDNRNNNVCNPTNYDYCSL